MNNYRYILEPYKGINTRFSCPKCGKKQVYTRYIDIETNVYLPFEFGKCNREINCGYHLDPYKEKFWQKEQNQISSFEKPKIPLIPKSQNLEPSFHSFDLVRKSLREFEHNSFVIFLFSKFGPKLTKYLINEYYLGTSKKYRKTGNGGVVFWNIDIHGKVRSGKIMGYDSKTGKRVKEPYPLQNWVHSVLSLEKFNLSHCFYGEHLLKKYPFKKVAIVESEKTAILSSVYLPQYIWLASGNLNGINEEKAKALKNRDVELFPDLSHNGRAFEIWENKSKMIIPFAKTLKVNDILERLAPEDHKNNGYDLGDYFSMISIEDWRDFGKNEKFKFDPVSKVYLNEHGYPASWDFFEKIEQKPLSNIEKLSKKNNNLKILIDRFNLVER